MPHGSSIIMGIYSQQWGVWPKMSKVIIGYIKKPQSPVFLMGIGVTLGHYSNQ